MPRHTVVGWALCCPAPLRQSRSPVLALLRNLQLQPHLVVDGVLQPLFAAEVSLRGLNRSVSEKELYLLQFTASKVAQPGASPPQIMGCKFLNARTLRSSFHNVPYRLRRNPVLISQALPGNFLIAVVNA